MKRPRTVAAVASTSGNPARRSKRSTATVASLDASAAIVAPGSLVHYDFLNSSQSRSALLNFPTTGRREITHWVRFEALRKLRALEANLGIIQRMKSQVGKYSVGFGIFPVPQTSHPEWNKAARDGFMDWANNPGVCDAAGAMNLWERQRYHAETFFAENESFDALVSSAFAGAPQLQLFDNAEIGGALVGSTLSGDPSVIDGVRVNAQNRPIAYLVTNLQPGQTFYSQPSFTEISANDMIHIVRRKRANQLRGLSPFAPAINTAIDVMDLDAVIMASAKLHNAMGVTVNKKSGDAGKKGITSQVNKLVDTTTGQVTQVDEKFIRGAVIQYLGLDEDLKIVSSDRPTQNLLEYLVYRIRHICLTTGLPFEIVWDMASLGGATARLAVEDAQWFFDGIQDLLNDRFNQRVWVWYCASMMKSGQLIACDDPRWWACHWQGPPKLTADAGRTAQSEIDLALAGMNSWQDYYAKRGRAWQPALQQRIDELQWLNKQCATAGVEPSLIFASKPGTILIPGNNPQPE